MFTEISLLITIVILLISNYLFQSESEQIKVPTQYQTAEQVNCQDCPPVSKLRCQACPTDPLKCATCAPNCNLCNTDCFKCKTGSCQPSCDRCLSSTCEPDCTKCSQGCPLDCSRLGECTLPFKECKIVGEGLSFNLIDYAIYNRKLRVYQTMMTVLTGKEQGHLITLVNSNDIISLYIINKVVKLYAVVNKKKVTLVTQGISLGILEPRSVYLRLEPTELLVAIDGLQFSVPVSNLDTTQRFTVYLGGLPSHLRELAYPTENPYVGFIGCLTDLTIDNSKTPQEFMLRGAQVGCPRKFLPG